MTAAARAPVADALGVGPGMRILDVGCGDGGFCALAAGRGIADARAFRLPDGSYRFAAALTYCVAAA